MQQTQQFADAADPAAAGYALDGKLTQQHHTYYVLSKLLAYTVQCCMKPPLQHLVD
jgi:hypothetical protein